MNIEKKMDKLRHLTQFKNLSDDELKKVAERKLAEEQIEDELLLLVNKEELEAAKKLYASYTSEYAIETSADKSTLYDLIYYEVLNLRIKQYLNNNQTAKDGTSPIVHSNTIETLQKNTEQIVKLKSLLGMTKKDADKENASVISIIENLKTRFHNWINVPENRANYTLKCPACKELILIRRRLDKEKDEVIRHPWYQKGFLLLNLEIFKDYKEGKIDIEQVARYLNTSTDYVDWLQKRYPFEINHKEDIENGNTASG